MHDILNSTKLAILIACILTYTWFQFYILFVVPPDHLTAFGKNILTLREGGTIHRLIIDQFLLGKKIYQISLLTFFDCFLLYCLKRNNMSSNWKKSLLFTTLAIAGLIACIGSSTPRIANDYEFIDSVISNKFIIYSLQIFFIVITFNKICLYLPSFHRLQTPPRTEL